MFWASEQAYHYNIGECVIIENMEYTYPGEENVQSNGNYTQTEERHFLSISHLLWGQ